MRAPTERSSSGAILLGALALLVAAGEAARAQAGRSCTGHSCGRELGFAVESCRARPGGAPGGGDICWERVPNGVVCELLGYTMAVNCPLADAFGGGLGGALTSTLPGSIGGFHTFQQQIQVPAVPRAFAAGGLTVDASEEGERRPRARFGELTTTVESEDWRLAGIDGETLGGAVAWTRESASGHLVGATGTFQRAEPRRSGRAELATLGAGYGHTLGARWKSSLQATYSRVSGFVDLDLYSAAGEVSFERPFTSGAVLSGGAVVQRTDAGGQGAPSFTTAGAGLAWGLPLGRRMTLDLDGFAVQVLAPSVESDLFATLGARFALYLSPRFGLHLGYRTLLGIEGLDSNTLTLGSSTRF